ncbi:MAG: hypothetical protein HY287_00600 [Planctomycetes bacterium]|nr:hypothetical protein [Planctomycetota bacterium]
MVDKLLTGGREREKDTLPSVYTVAHKANWNADTRKYAEWNEEIEALRMACWLLGKYMSGDPPEGFIKELRKCASNLPADDIAPGLSTFEEMRFQLLVSRPRHRWLMSEFHRLCRRSNLPASEKTLKNVVDTFVENGFAEFTKGEKSGFVVTPTGQAHHKILSASPSR